LPLTEPETVLPEAPDLPAVPVLLPPDPPVLFDEVAPAEPPAPLGNRPSDPAEPLDTPLAPEDLPAVPAEPSDIFPGFDDFPQPASTRLAAATMRAILVITISSSDMTRATHAYVFIARSSPSASSAHPKDTHDDANAATR
jgi:hypothetical protein